MPQKFETKPSKKKKKKVAKVPGQGVTTAIYYVDFILAESQLGVGISEHARVIQGDHSGIERHSEIDATMLAETFRSGPLSFQDTI